MSPNFKLLAAAAIVLASACGSPTPEHSISQALDASPTLGEFVAYAERSIALGAHDDAAGDIGIAMPAVTTVAQLVIGDHSSSSSDLFAPTITLGDDSSVRDVEGALEGSDGSYSELAPYPLTAMPPLPLALSASTSTLPVSVPQSEQQQLAPGMYGDLDVAGTLVLTTGEYSFTNVTVESHGSIAASAGNVDFRVSGTLTIQDHVSVEPNGTASMLVFSVSGDDTPNQAAVTVGSHSYLHCLLSSPHGTISLADHVSVLGAIAASDIVAIDHVSLTLEDGFEPNAGGTHGSQLLSGYLGTQPDGSFPVISPVTGDTVVSLSIGLPVSDPEGLANFLDEVSDSTSANYRQYLSVSDFNTTYGASGSDYAALQAWATAEGFTIDHTFSNNLLLSVHAPAIAVESAFHTNLVLRQTSDGVNASSFVAVDREPSVDLSPTLLWVTGFDDYQPPQPATCAEVPQHCCTTDADCGETIAGELIQVGRCLGTVDSGGICQVGVCAIGNTTDPGINGGPSDHGYLMAGDLRAAYLGVGTMCSSLDGTGQVVGIVSLSDFDMNDISNYMIAQTASSGAVCSPACSGDTTCFNGKCVDVTAQVTRNEVTQPEFSNDSEAPLDIEMVLAMAPQASIVVYEGTAVQQRASPLSVGHIDDILATMATDGRLTVATSSWSSGRSDNSTQSLEQMAAQGVTFFDASGDNGNVGDPQDTADMPYQTLVGGTILSVNNVSPGPTYCSASQSPTCYYASEATWNQGCPGFTRLGDRPIYQGNPDGDKDITSGGIMDGLSPGTAEACDCFPQPLCCGAGVGIPGYQKDPSLSSAIDYSDPASGGNGASTSSRNYPDVSAVAYNVAVYQGTGFQPVGGTSVAAPVWAGFTALANQFAATNNVAPLGFANPTLYAIGLTRGQPGNSDLYKTSFNDVADGIFNSDTVNTVNEEIVGFPSDAGYDLATGWGSPTCGLIQQLGTPDPVAPQTYTQVFIHLDNGHDGLNDASSVTMDLLDTTGVPINSVPFPIKSQGEQFWDAIGCAHDIGPFDIPATNPFDVGGITLHLDENGQGGLDGDNWDIAGVSVRLVGVGPSAPATCITELSFGNGCDQQQPSCVNGSLVDGHPGVARLSATVSSSGQGPDISFFTDPNSASWGGCAQAHGAANAQPFDNIVFRFDTADDDLDPGSEVDYQLMQRGSDGGMVPIPGATGTIHAVGDDDFEDQTERLVTIPGYGLTLGQIAGVQLSFIANGNSDNWHVEDIDAWGVNSQAPWESTCVFQGTAGVETAVTFGTGGDLHPTYNFSPGMQPLPLDTSSCD